MHVTVAICTYNRARLLDQTLTAFHGLRVPGDVTWELLVVNNNCTDETSDVATRHTSHLPLRLLYETAPGLSAARNCAAQAATGELILFTDDDVLVDPEWLAEYANAARAWPDAGFFGGTIIPWFPMTPPKWVMRNLDPLSEPYALAQYGEVVRPIADLRPVVGANMGLRTAVLRRFPFDANVGQIGNSAVRGDETELFARIRGAGVPGVWVGTAIVRHYVQPERLTTKYLWHWYGGLGAGMARRDGVPECTRFLGAPRWAVKKYGVLLLEYSCRSVFRDSAWIRTLRQAGLMRGYIEEARRLHRVASDTP